MYLYSYFISAKYNLFAQKKIEKFKNRNMNNLIITFLIKNEDENKKT